MRQKYRETVVPLKYCIVIIIIIIIMSFFSTSFFVRV